MLWYLIHRNPQLFQNFVQLTHRIVFDLDTSLIFFIVVEFNTGAEMRC